MTLVEVSEVFSDIWATTVDNNNILLLPLSLLLHFIFRNKPVMKWSLRHSKVPSDLNAHGWWQSTVIHQYNDTESCKNSTLFNDWLTFLTCYVNFITAIILEGSRPYFRRCCRCLRVTWRGWCSARRGSGGAPRHTNTDGGEMVLWSACSCSKTRPSSIPNKDPPPPSPSQRGSLVWAFIVVISTQFLWNFKQEIYWLKLIVMSGLKHGEENQATINRKEP